jgi:hypothetical protein
LSTPEIEALKAALLGRLSSLVHALYGDRAKWTGHEWRIGDVSGEPGSSMAIEGKDPARLGLWHDHNPSAEKRGGDVLGLVAGARDTDFKGAVAWAKAFLEDAGLPPAPVRPQVVVGFNRNTDLKSRDGELLKPAHPRSLTQASNALFKHKGAMAQLRKRGLSLATIRHFHLGLYSYEGTQSRVKNALSAPVLGADGVPLKRSLFSRLPNVTEGGPDPAAKDWAAGKPGTYWVTPRQERTELFVCEGAKDGWWLWQALRGSSVLKRLCLITSTHGSGIPEAWHSPMFWRDWDKVYLGQDADEAGDALAHRVRELAGRDVYRVRVPGDYGKDWTDFFRGGQRAEDLAALLEAAPIFDVKVQGSVSPTLPDHAGTYDVTPVDVSRAYVNGHLYAPFRVLESQVEKVRGPNGRPVERTVQRYRTLVLRSDGTVCTYDYRPAPRGTPRQDRVLALSDGTLLSRAPMVDDTRMTFSPSAITRFRDARAAGRSAMTLTPQKLLEGVHEHLKASSVLTREEDYALLTFVVVTSYAQAIFDAAPLVWVVGSGGSTLGRALAQLGCNASLVTRHASAAIAARALDRLGGLAVVDLEGISRRSSEGEFREFVQQLGASIRKASATTTWTDPTTMRVEKLDLYGVKVVTGALGADTTFPVPVLKVYARKPSKETQPERHLPYSTDLQELRDNLHLWVLENVGRIDGLYRHSYSQHRSPLEALTAPLKVLADLLGHPALSGQLQAALALQEAPVPEAMSAVQRVHAAVRNLIRQGYRKKLTLKQLMLELRLLAENDAVEASNTTTPEWREPRWVGRTLRAEKLIDPYTKDERRWLWGEQTRVLTLEPGFVAKTLQEFDTQGTAYVPSSRGPLEFCLLKPCDECSYADFCTMRPRKEKH